MARWRRGERGNWEDQKGSLVRAVLTDARREDCQLRGAAAVARGRDGVVELMGGTDPAFDYALRSLRAGRHLVTANKQLLSHYGEQLFEAAGESGAQLRFEADHLLQHAPRPPLLPTFAQDPAEPIGARDAVGAGPVQVIGVVGAGPIHADHDLVGVVAHPVEPPLQVATGVLGHEHHRQSHAGSLSAEVA